MKSLKLRMNKLKIREKEGWLIKLRCFWEVRGDGIGFLNWEILYVDEDDFFYLFCIVYFIYNVGYILGV